MPRGQSQVQEAWVYLRHYFVKESRRAIKTRRVAESERGEERRGRRAMADGWADA